MDLTKKEIRKRLLLNLGYLTAFGFTIFCIIQASVTGNIWIKVLMITLVILCIIGVFAFGFYRVKLTPALIDWIYSGRSARSSGDDSLVCSLALYILLSILLAGVLVVVLAVDSFNQIRALNQPRTE